MARLDHPNLLRIFDAGRSASGPLYLVLELMDGTCARYRRLEPTRALDLTVQLLAGLQALHDARVLHRDIKPANCLVRDRDQRVKLADLGIAIERATKTYQVADASGTLPFMAPELFDVPARFSPGSDLYALGITLQCMVLEADPFPRTSQTEIMAWIFSGERANVAAQRPDLPIGLTTVIERLSARSPVDRPPSAAAALAQLSASPTPLTSPASDLSTTLEMIGPWLLGQQTHGDGNFARYAVTHAKTGAPGRLAALRPGRPLSEQSSLMLASAQRAAKLSHQGIVDVIDWGTHAGRAYVVTRPQGQSLRRVIESSGAMGELEAVELARGLADALAYLHGEGLVYQILTPQSAVLAADARSAQLAWPLFCVPIGSSSDPASGALMHIAVPRFAAPESLARPSSRAEDAVGATAVRAIQPSVDLYGLGETLYYLIAGKPAFSNTPFMTTLLLEKMRGPADLRAVAPSTTAPTAQLVAELTAPYAQQRPPTAAAVRDELARIATRLQGVG
jgi:serine/threonine protein kinase